MVGTPPASGLAGEMRTSGVIPHRVLVMLPFRVAFHHAMHMDEKHLYNGRKSFRIHLITRNRHAEQEM